MKVLADTSVWIRFLSNQKPYAEGLESLLRRDQVTAHDLVQGELLIGDKGARKQLMAFYALLEPAQMVPHIEVVAFVRARKLHGRGIGWIDVHLLASALVSGSRLWTADQALAAIANELGVHYNLA